MRSGPTAQNKVFENDGAAVCVEIHLNNATFALTNAWLTHELLMTFHA